MSHFGDGHLEDANEGTEEVGRRDCNLGLKGIETLLAYILQPTEATATEVLVLRLWRQLARLLKYPLLISSRDTALFIHMHSVKCGLFL